MARKRANGPIGSDFGDFLLQEGALSSTARAIKRVPAWQLLTLVCLLCALPSGAKADSAAWRWFADCSSSRELAIRVALDHKTLFRKVVPICQTDTQDHRSFKFAFTAARPIRWAGYGDENLRTAKATRIEGNIWLAGGEPNALILGVSFSTKTTIVMNTVHIAKPLEDTGYEMEEGLLITTQPLHGWSLFHGRSLASHGGP
jgi:hypothetical protein